MQTTSTISAVQIWFMPTLGVDFGGEFGRIQAMQLVAGRRPAPMLPMLTHVAFITSELTANFLRFPKEFKTISATRKGDELRAIYWCKASNRKKTIAKIQAVSTHLNSELAQISAGQH